jgi:hypothetical protein
MKKSGFGTGALLFTMVLILGLGNGSTGADLIASQDFSAASPPKIQTDIYPDSMIVCPEVIWAPASGGGVWESQLSLLNFGGGSDATDVYVIYYPITGPSVNVKLWTSSEQYQSVKFDNVLETIGTLSGDNLYGTVGTLLLWADDDNLITAVVQTTNGNYGKSFPAVPYADAYSANQDRYMFIQNIENNSDYRTAVGCWNGCSGGYEMEVHFAVVNENNVQIGDIFVKIIPAWGFISFDPFAEAGITQDYDNCSLVMYVSDSNPAPYEKGMFWYASKVNNNSNDTSALFAMQRNNL